MTKNLCSVSYTHLTLPTNREDCAICRQISICENLLKSLGLAGAAAAISAAFTYTVCRAILPCAEMNGTLTLVALKVKLSN